MNPQLIYIKTPKTGGTSVTALLKSIFPNNLHIAGRHKTWPPTSALEQAELIVLGEAIAKKFRKKYSKLWHNGYSFAISRNPFDKAISAWQYLPSIREVPLEKALTTYKPLRPYRKLYELDYINAWHDYIHFSQPQSDWIIDRFGLMITNEVIRYEQLEPSITRLLQNLNIKSPELQWLNRTNRQANLEVSSKSLEIIKKQFHRDFKTLCYSKIPPREILELIRSESPMARDK